MERRLLMLEGGADMADDKDETGKAEEPAPGPEESCNMWDWARTAGLSREELRRAIEQARPSADRKEA